MARAYPKKTGKASRINQRIVGQAEVLSGLVRPQQKRGQPRGHAFDSYRQSTMLSHNSLDPVASASI